MAVDRTEHLVSVRFTAYLGLPTREMQNASQTQKTGLRNPSESFGKPVYPSEKPIYPSDSFGFFFWHFFAFLMKICQNRFSSGSFCQNRFSSISFCQESVFFEKFLSRIGFPREVFVKNRFSSRRFCQESVFLEKVLSRIGFFPEVSVKNHFVSESLSQEPVFSGSLSQESIFFFRKCQSRIGFSPKI